MALKLITPPTQEPITLAEAKSHLRVDDSSEDSLITALISTAREHAETITGRALMTQTWRMTLESWPSTSEILLPFPPLQSVDSLKYKDKDGIEITWDPANYIVDTDSEPGRIVLAYDKSWPNTTNLYPANPITVQFVAGYTDAAAVPSSIKQAMLLLIGHLYENREAVVLGNAATLVPLAVESLFWPNRVMRWL